MMAATGMKPESLPRLDHDPSRNRFQVARQALVRLSGALIAAATHAESAQGALNSQGYDLVPTNRAFTKETGEAFVTDPAATTSRSVIAP